MEDIEGATDNELMLAACRNDQDEMLEDILKEDDYDINFTDGVGDTAAHYAAQFGALICLEILVTVKNIKLNAKNRVEGNTPLHKAVLYNDDPDIALAMVDVLLEAGADPRIENKDKQTPVMLVNPKNDDMKELFDQALAGYEMHDSDIADDEKYDDDEDDDFIHERDESDGY
ncbi:hypothetical protein DFQ28_002921 [Apophysomyces sp. BC1034]|nr:hypothetical protein DFQ30_003250 [Apophysomyces sp. BC1015]KAG0179299.1 hypothetical protein DFQ29_002272 [Apophysomyces sp. BC1021]KAG0189761.1 hypothetical protein DFQ28_002921 [Apophysomyces sp. BC1034]